MTGPSLIVSLPGQQVGQLERNRSGLTLWRPSAAWEENGQHPRLGVGFLRKPGQRLAGTGLPAWFDNLLPDVDSALRQRMCIAHGLRESDVFGLLRALGSDLAGAVEISAATGAATSKDESSAHSQSDDAQAGAVAPPNQLRFSLAGMQLKFSMSMANERLTLGASGAGAKWIVKLPSYRFLPRGPSLSLGLGGERRFARINTLVLDHHVERSGCPWAKDEILSGIERARDAWASSVEAMRELMRRALETHWERVPLPSGMLRG
jgi:HipA-like protein